MKAAAVCSETPRTIKMALPTSFFRYYRSRFDGSWGSWWRFVTLIGAGFDPARTESTFHRCIFASGARLMAVNGAVESTKVICESPQWGAVRCHRQTFPYPTAETCRRISTAATLRLCRGQASMSQRFSTQRRMASQGIKHSPSSRYGTLYRRTLDPLQAVAPQRVYNRQHKWLRT